MSLFRSEEHLERWLGARGFARGEVAPLGTVWRLAGAWYTDPRIPGWRPRSRDASQAVLASVGLTGEFWEMAK